jgi:PadR family transcriptional regulator PadR
MDPGGAAVSSDLNLIRGTLDLLVLKAISGEARHGYAISQWIKEVTEGEILVEEGSLYPALHRIERKGWISADWGVSDTGRRARFYELTDDGRERLAHELRTWERYSKAIQAAVGA